MTGIISHRRRQPSLRKRAAAQASGIAPGCSPKNIYKSVPFIAQQGLDIVAFQLLSALKPFQFHDKQDPHHFAAELFDEPDNCFGGAAGGDQIIDDDDLLAGLNGILWPG